MHLTRLFNLWFWMKVRVICSSLTAWKTVKFNMRNPDMVSSGWLLYFTESQPLCDEGEKGLHVRKGAKEKHQKTRPSAPEMWQSWVDTCPHTDTPETREAERWEELEVLFLLWLEVAWPHTLLLGPCYWLPVSVATISGNRSGIRRTTESSCNRTWDDPLPHAHSHTHTLELT